MELSGKVKRYDMYSYKNQGICKISVMIQNYAVKVKCIKVNVNLCKYINVLNGMYITNYFVIKGR